jgi:D-inositol-3-phosphate glycosyltransferase
LMLHTSPLEQAGIGDAGGMNVYVVESAKRIAESGIGVDIYTRANRSGLPEVVEIADGVNVRHLEAGPYGGITKDELPSQVCALMSSFMHQEARLASNYYELVHSHYLVSASQSRLLTICIRWQRLKTLLLLRARKQSQRLELLEKSR